ncbi:MAG: hypothetical protein HY901_07050 [Deltaproteobacteria bacterium]|nr:hypothetical protein [Deltaproteobacteria bacterium]
MSSIRESATFYRAALWLGLVRSEDVVRWADSLIEAGSDGLDALCEVALTPPHDLTALRRALQLMAEERESQGVVAQLLELVAADLAAGRRSARDTITVLGQMHSGIALPKELREALHPFGIQYSLASAGVENAIEDLEARLRDWLLPWAAMQRQGLARK